MNVNCETLSNSTDLAGNRSVIQSNSNENIYQILDHLKSVLQQGNNSSRICLHLTMNPGTNVQCGIHQAEFIGPRSQPEQNVDRQSIVGMRRRTSPLSRTPEDRPSKRQRSESRVVQLQSPNKLVELRSLQDSRERMYYHCPDNSQEFCRKLIKAGFFHCNVGDRTICIYCNLICQQWRRELDDPSEVHKTLSPNCIYVRGYLTPAATASNETVDQGASSAGTTVPLLPDASVDRAESGTNTCPI